MGKPSPPSGGGSTQAESAMNRAAARDQTYANKTDVYGPFGSSINEAQQVAIQTGSPVVKLPSGRYADAEWFNSTTPEERQRQWNEGTAPIYGHTDVTEQWTNTQALNPEWQKFLDNQRGVAEQQQVLWNTSIQDRIDNPLDYTQIGDWSSLSPTANVGGMESRFGLTNPNMGAQDWRQFGVPTQTIGADDWRQHGYSTPTVGADDWREFGTTDQTINAGTYDERFGSQPSYRDEFGDHSTDGQDWNLIDYAPDVIRRQAEQDTLNFMYGQLDPQWDTREQDLMTQLANQGLSYGDAAYTNALAGFNRQKNLAYESARNQALADSRAEAMMLWDQEMARSEQENQYTQQDWANAYQARQANIANLLQDRGQEAQDFLAYQQAAYGQDYQTRQQQLDADWRYGQLAHAQDLAARQQALDADLGFGREAYMQDLQTSQYQADQNRLYSQLAFDQDLAARQQAISTALQENQMAYDQRYQTQALHLTSAQQQELMNQQYLELMNPSNTIATTAQAIG